MNQPATCDYRFSPASFSRCVFWPHATSLPFPNRDLMSERRIHLLGASSPTSANSSSVRSVRWSNSHQPSPASEHSRARRSARMASAPWRCPRACSISLSMRSATTPCRDGVPIGRVPTLPGRVVTRYGARVKRSGSGRPRRRTRAAWASTDWFASFSPRRRSSAACTGETS